MKIVCPACRKAYRIPDGSAGKRVKCSCGNRFVADQKQPTQPTAVSNPPNVPPVAPKSQTPTPPETGLTNPPTESHAQESPDQESSLPESPQLKQGFQDSPSSKPPRAVEPPRKQKPTNIAPELNASPPATPSEVPLPPDLRPASSATSTTVVGEESLPNTSSGVDSQSNSDAQTTPAPQFAVQIESSESGIAGQLSSRRSGQKNATIWIGGIAVVLVAIFVTLIAQSQSGSSGSEESVGQNTPGQNDSDTQSKPGQDSKNQGSANNNAKQPSGQQLGTPPPQKKDLSSTAQVKSEILKNRGTNAQQKSESTPRAIIYVPDMKVEVELEEWQVPDMAPEAALEAFLNSSGIERERAEEALLRGGQAALQEVLKKIREIESERANQFANGALCRMLWKFGPQSTPFLVSLAKDESLQSTTRSKIIRAIGDIGPAARDAIPDLVEIYDNAGAPSPRSVKLTAVNSIRLIGVHTPDVERILLEILKDTDQIFPAQYLTVAITAVKTIGPDAKNLVPALRVLLVNNKNAARDVAEALAAIGPPAGASAKEFAQLLGEKNSVVSYRAFHALRDIGPTASEAVPALIKVLQESTNDFERVNAASALGRIGPAAAGALPTLREYFVEAEREKQDQAPRVAYRLAMARIKGNQAEAVPYIRSALYDNKHNARTNAAEYVGTLGKDGTALVPDLSNLILNLDSKEGAVRLAIHSLGHLGEHGKDGLGALIKFINKEHLDPNGQKTYRMHAMTAIAQINSDDRVKRGLEELARNDPKLTIREHAQRLLFSLKSN